MPVKNIAIVSFLFVLLLSSCTVEKRRYLKGYHISRHNSSKNTAVKKINSQEPKDFITMKSIENNESEKQFLKSNNYKEDPINKEEMYRYSLPKNIDSVIDGLATKEQPETNGVGKNMGNKIEESRELHPNTVLGIITAALSLPAALGMIAAFSGGIFSIILGILLFFIWLLLLIFGFSFSITAFTNTLDYPKEYKGPVWAALGIALSIASAVLFIFLIGLL